MNDHIRQQHVTVETHHGPVDIEYLAAGQGIPVLLLHGAADSAYSWRWIVPFLVPGHALYAPSLPGLGQSDKPRLDYSPAFFTETVAAFLDRLGLDRVRVVGHSLGGLIALRLALEQPARVSALALIGSAGLGREVSPAVRGLLMPGVREFVSLWCQTWLGAWQWSAGISQLLFARPWTIAWPWYERQYRLALRPGHLEATLSALETINTLWSQAESVILLDRLDRVSQPVLVLWGERDLIFPVRQGRVAVERLRRGRLVVLPACGHTAQVEQPERVAAALDDFWRTAEPDGSASPAQGSGLAIRRCGSGAST